MQFQQTLGKSYSFEGKGLHTGKVAKMTVGPAPADTGVVFRRVDLGQDALVEALAENVSSTARSTTIAKGAASVSTIEHIMSALTGLGIDNAYIDIDNVEVPILDGSAKPYIDAMCNDEVLVQDVGYNGSDANTLDVVHGYNKASVKSVNNVFDEVIPEEPFEILDVVQTWEWNEEEKEDALRAVRKFKKPMLWEMYYYDHHMNPLTQEQIAQMDINTDVVGAVECADLGYRITEKDGVWVPKDKEFNWEDTIKVRLSMYEYIINGGDDKYKAFTVKGVNSVWKDGAFGVTMNIRHTTGAEMVYTAQTVVDTYLYFVLRIGDYYYNGTDWVKSYSTFRIRYNVNTGSGYQPIESNLNASMPYRGLQGYVVELPQDRVLKGELEFTMFINDPGDSTISGYFIKDFKLDYAKKEGTKEEGEDGDRVYENVVNEAYMSEADEIEFEIGSYNEDGATYSKALLGDDFLTDNLYCAIVGKNVRPEELMIRRIVNRYGATKIKLTEALRMTGEITPLTAVSDRTMVGKRFRMTSGEWDYEQNRLTLQMQEDVV
jgi:hypothetical protein